MLQICGRRLGRDGVARRTGVDMENAWQRYMDLVSGLTQVTQKRAEDVVRTLVRRGEIEANKGEKTVESLLSRVEQNRKAVVSIARSEIEDAVRRLGLARQSDIDRLQARIARLEAEVHGRPPKAPPPKTEKELLDETPQSITSAEEEQA
jgi:polyhydroxyalkanoate synthesis regulator phasin